MNNLDQDKDLVPLGDNNIPKQEDGRQDNLKVDNILNPWAADSLLWTKIFLASCVIGISIDPLFLYIPIVDDDRKCIEKDHNMVIVALVLRSLTDFSYVFHICFRLHTALKMSKKLHQSIFKKFPWSYLFTDLLSILPLPQVIILMYFSKITGSKSLTARKFINLILLLQYVPRIFRVYLSTKELAKNFDTLTGRLWVRGGFLFFFYIIFGHVFGAFWYFYSIYRETACWHHACEYYGPKECTLGPFDCHLGSNHPIKNLTKLNQFCPISPPNPEIFNFGIFSGAIESRIVNKTDFPQKFTRSFWWGLKNLSSFGSNLDTSSNVQENLFAILISILGLLLFLYLIGNLQTYMQLETTRSEEARRKISIIQPEVDSYLSNHGLPTEKRKLINRCLSRTIREGKDFDVKHLFFLVEEHANLDHQHKGHDETFAGWVTKLMKVEKSEGSTMEQKVELWISKNGIPDDLGSKIMNYVRFRMQEEKDVDIEYLLRILPPTLGVSIKKHMCFSILKKVPFFENIDEDHVYETIYKILKPVVYSERSYIIRKEEPIDMMLFITQGMIWSFGSGTTQMNRLQKGDHYGKELIEWKFESSSYDDFPISTTNLKAHNKVEAFALMESDLNILLSKYWLKFYHKIYVINKKLMPVGLKTIAVNAIIQNIKCSIDMKKKKGKKSNKLNHHEVSVEINRCPPCLLQCGFGPHGCCSISRCEGSS
ncbi:cyclic nucleotide-gated ion channel 1 [Cannabis sativa]|uniref:cyclic nucleotide-gated ion channel 1 n=1 Tax=Cannabis sativa TaxID=3483 RepID=UPI0029C9F2A4|nr:cyclic nucleotide-gated ion channel 1 [Cannabis sativa]XP_030500232.2 cyclic nucleotide-gated ion channel 1 [Cannabis sativa]XP_060971191.1 cyclic nucleotide-gated ion channel 1 [Cannabis sativa]XP_060971192.1 cyclic nucleotide-gated ion channel 1 [Cannabis sativa]